MEGHRRGADGRRIFSTVFKLEQIGRVERREVTLAELSRERRSVLATLEGSDPVV